MNRLYYSLFSIVYFINHYFLGKAIEVFLCRPLYLIPFIKKHLDKNNLTYKEWIKKSDNVIDQSMSYYFISFFMAYIVTSPLFLIVILLQILIGDSVRKLWAENLLIVIIIIIGFSYLFCYYFVWRGDRYQKYFLIFNHEGVKKRVIWSLFTLLYSILYAIFFLLLFKYAEMRLGYWR